MSSEPRVLVVEDDENLSYLLEQGLSISGFRTSVARDGDEGWKVFQDGEFDLVITDIMMPKMDGFDLAKRIRQRNELIPLVFLTAKNQQEDKIQGFQLGGDDYITKPFSIEELVLRLKAILRRAGLFDETDTEIQIGKYSLDTGRYELRVENEIKKLTIRECELLRYFASHTNQLLERDKILSAVWKDDSYFNGRSMDVFISRLRKYLKSDSSIEIKNVHGVGYRFEISG